MQNLDAKGILNHDHKGDLGYVVQHDPNVLGDGNVRTVAHGLNIPEDPRIPYLARTPGHDLSERDVLILHAAARYYLETGQAKRIEDGDKSVSRPGVYYLNFGRTQNTFFRPGDIPDLERRIQDLQR